VDAAAKGAGFFPVADMEYDQLWPCEPEKLGRKLIHIIHQQPHDEDHGHHMRLTDLLEEFSKTRVLTAEQVAEVWLYSRHFKVWDDEEGVTYVRAWEGRDCETCWQQGTLHGSWRDVERQSLDANRAERRARHVRAEEARHMQGARQWGRPGFQGKGFEGGFRG